MAMWGNNITMKIAIVLSCTICLISCHPYKSIFVRNLCNSEQKVSVNHDGVHWNNLGGSHILLSDTIAQMKKKPLSNFSYTLAKDSLDKHNYELNIPPLSTVLLKPVGTRDAIRWIALSDSDTLYYYNFYDRNYQKEIRISKTKGTYDFYIDLCPREGDK